MIDMKYIKIAMINKNINNNDMSKLLNLNVNTISRWINGNNLYNIEKFIDMLNILDIKVSDIKKE